MFEVPDAKRVKRSDLFRDDDNNGSPGSRGSSRSTSPARSSGNDEESILRSRYGFEYDFVTPNPPSRKPTLASSHSQPDVHPEEEDQEFQFRLFTSNSKSIDRPSQPDVPTADSRIRLSRTPEPAALADSLSLENAHFLRPKRPDSYYFTSALPGEAVEALRSQYADVSLSTADVLSRAKSTKWPGSALPWRLIHVELLGKGRRRRFEEVAQSAASSTANTGDTSSQRRSKPSSKRPSKKRRILLRRRLALRQELAAQARATEETEREKRTRRNREKKVKRKEREKRKKLEEAPEGEEGKPAGGGGGGEEEQKVIPTKERSLRTEADVRAAHSVQEGEIRPDEKDSAAKAPDLVTTAQNAAAAAVLPTNMSTSSAPAPARRAPTSRAPTTAAAVNPRVSRSLHPTRPRP